jgi:esterase/lipase
MGYFLGYVLCKAGSRRAGLKIGGLKMKKVTVEYKNQKKIVTLPSGEKREHTRDSLSRAKDMFLQRRKKVDEQIALIDNDLKKMG